MRWRRRVSTCTDTQRGQVLKLTETEARLSRRFAGESSEKTSRGCRHRPGLVRRHKRDLRERRTRIRDQERSPIAADLKRLMREKSRRSRGTLHLRAGVAEAHRQVPIQPQDWHMLGCQVKPGEAVYVHTVGTFGVASASYYWSRGVSRNTVPEAKRTRGINWLLTISTSRQEVPSIAPHSSPSSLFVSSLRSLFLAENRLVPSCSTARDLLSAAQRSLSSGHALQPNKKQSTWPSLRRVWEESCT